MPASDVLEELYALDPCSSDFPRTLFSFIKSDEEEQYSKNLEGEELTRLMDFLDNVRPLPISFFLVANKLCEGSLFHPHYR